VSANDGRRFRALASFVYRTFPDVHTIADVAGGRGRLSYRLHQLGYSVTTIDTRSRTLPRFMHRALRKQSVKHGRLIEIPRVVAQVQDIDLRPFDLITALHPDEATEPALRTALELDKPFAIVPCCVFPIDGIKRTQADWFDYLRTLAPDIATAELPVNGANTVLYRSAR